MKKSRLIWIAVVGVTAVAAAVYVRHRLTYVPPPPSDSTLLRVLADATKLVVRSGGLCHRDVSTEKTLFMVESLPEVADIVAHLHIDEGGSGFHCMCCGEPTFEFYRGRRLVAAVGFHHGRSIRWRGWQSDGLLTKESADYLVAVLARHGIHKKDYE